MDKATMIKVFNEWLRRLIEDRKKFEEDSFTIINFLWAQKEGVPPSYGEQCAEYMFKVAEELTGKRS